MKLGLLMLWRMRQPAGPCPRCLGDRRIETGIVHGETRYAPCPRCRR